MKILSIVTLYKFENQSVVLTDTLNMTANELKRSLTKLISEGETDIKVALQKDAGIEVLTAIKEGLANAENYLVSQILEIKHLWEQLN